MKPGFVEQLEACRIFNVQSQNRQINLRTDFKKQFEEELRIQMTPFVNIEVLHEAIQKYNQKSKEDKKIIIQLFS